VACHRRSCRPARRVEGFHGRRAARNAAAAIDRDVALPLDSRQKRRSGRRSTAREARRRSTPDLFLLNRRWMKRLPPRTTDARIVWATIVFIALGAWSSSAQSREAIGTADSRACRWRDRTAVGLPASIQVADDLLPRLHVMLERSPTFRSQCRRIAEAPHLYVRVRLDMAIIGRTYRAVTKICRQPSGAIVAAIDIAPFGDPAEWLAHEFEHLIEQLDGVNLRELERRRQGAWQSGNQMFETERAVRVGRLVFHEMR
jgi:hypothetical protein